MNAYLYKKKSRINCYKTPGKERIEENISKIEESNENFEKKESNKNNEKYENNENKENIENKKNEKKQ